MTLKRALIGVSRNTALASFPGSVQTSGVAVFVGVHFLMPILWPIVPSYHDSEILRYDTTLKVIRARSFPCFPIYICVCVVLLTLTQLTSRKVKYLTFYYDGRRLDMDWKNFRI